jgi:Escherichia/Staphylococcus phage prohead protease
MKMLHKDFGLEVKAVNEEGIVEGYASVFGGAPDLYGDVISPGAFAENLAKHRREGTMPLFLWGHDSSQPPIGNWTEMAEDGKGLWVKGEIDLEDPLGLRVHRALKRKAMKGLSIGYETREAEADPKRPGVRFLKSIDLWEVSPVNFPAQTRAAVDNVKSYTAADALPTLPEFEEFLREAGGFSKSLATAIAGKGLATLLRSESGKDLDADRERFLAGLRG